jgi:hypothetical protein
MKEISHITSHLEDAQTRLRGIRHHEHESKECIQSMYYILGSLCASVKELHERLIKVEEDSNE